jgi:clan AA aspartic protease
MVDTGAMHLCVPEEIAVQLGFDSTETEIARVTVADGRSLVVPKIAPIKIEFSNRSYVTEAYVIGDGSLLGVVPIEAMDLIVDPVSQQLRVNPAHPNYSVFPV